MTHARQFSERITDDSAPGVWEEIWTVPDLMDNDHSGH
jgi:hypothetical protein